MSSHLDRRRTIWVVDDSATDANRVSKLLSSEHDVEMIHDGAAALERLASGAIPDVLLLDWMMPGISGIEVCEYVRSQGKLPPIPILLLTAHHGTQEIIQAFKAGANDYVSKPFVDEELKARVTSLISSKQLLERAEQAEADVRTLLTNAPDPTFAVDAQGKITFANDEGVRILGRESRQIIGQAFTQMVPGISLLHIGIGAGLPLLPLPEVQIGERTYSPSFRVLPSDSAASTTVSLRDVTDRKQVENRRLDFYSIIAHDLRTPITSVLLRIQLAFRGRFGILPAGLVDELRRMETSLRSQIAMINDFLDLAKLEGVGYKIDHKPVDLNELIQATIEDFQPLIDKNKQSWKMVSPERALLVLGDRRRLAQVVANLIGNAIKFTPQSGSITTIIKAGIEHIELSVEDTGRGIAHEDLEGIFERFTRARDSASTTTGTGLGLMIVREIVEAHGGTLGVESKLGVGSKFWVRIPRFQPMQLSAPKAGLGH